MEDYENAAVRIVMQSLAEALHLAEEQSGLDAGLFQRGFENIARNRDRWSTLDERTWEVVNAMLKGLRMQMLRLGYSPDPPDSV